MKEKPEGPCRNGASEKRSGGRVQLMVDRAGFEPAAFRFFLAWMRTGRSLAPYSIWAYQAELPALKTYKTYSTLNGLSDPQSR